MCVYPDLVMKFDRFRLFFSEGVGKFQRDGQTSWEAMNHFPLCPSRIEAAILLLGAENYPSGEMSNKTTRQKNLQGRPKNNNNSSSGQNNKNRSEATSAKL